MTIARRRGMTLDTAAAAGAPSPPARVRVPGLGFPIPRGDVPAPDAATPLGRLRRCTFRRIDSVSSLPGRPRSTAYEVMCLYGDEEVPLALGDIDSARSTCDACTASGIFRPDED